MAFPEGLASQEGFNCTYTLQYTDFVRSTAHASNTISAKFVF